MELSELEEFDHQLALAIQKIGTTVEQLNDALTMFLNEMPRELIDHELNVFSIKSNPNLGNASKRRLIKMLNRSYRKQRC